ncbi:MAG: hypothetical protein RLZZ546_2107 [Bacteroidota bacterium]|jgi:membrane protease YdiL (CAAX protease family)
MYRFLLKHNIKLAVGVGTLITTLFFIILFVNLDDNLMKYKDRLDEIEYFNFGLISMLLLLIIAIALLIFFGLKNIFENRKKQKKGLFIYLIFFILFFLIFFLSQPEASGLNAELYQKFNISTNIYKYINSGIWMMIILFLGAIFSVLFMEIKSLLK